MDAKLLADIPAAALQRRKTASLKAAEKKLPSPTSSPSHCSEADFELERRHGIQNQEAIDVVVSGTIQGARFEVAEPEVSWNGGLLIYAHGFRPRGHGLKVELRIDKGSCYRRLLDEGWIVAATSYRREGVILVDAMRDILNLREYVCSRYGEPREVIIEGQSMGGGIATLFAEEQHLVLWKRKFTGKEEKLEPGKHQKSLISGILAVGAALMWRQDAITEEEKKLKFTNVPKIPVLYLTNDSELGPIQKYVQKCREERTRISDDTPLPAIWTVARAGHNWTNQEERYRAVKSLCLWIKFGTFITARNLDGTIPTKLRESTAEFDPGELLDGKAANNSLNRVATGRVDRIKASGTIVTTFVQPDLKRLGLRLGSSFKAEVNGHNVSNVILDEYPFVRAKKGTWVAMFEPEEGLMLLSILGPYDNNTPADIVGRARAGDAVKIESFLPITTISSGKRGGKRSTSRLILQKAALLKGLNTTRCNE